MSTNATPSENDSVTTEADTEEQTREDCWCADHDLACFDHYQSEGDDE